MLYQWRVIGFAATEKWGPLVRVFVPVNGCASVTLSHIRDIRRDTREAACDRNTLAAWHYF
jgi:hypothetical protein